MNDVSWRRILQRAGDGFPGDSPVRGQRNGRGGQASARGTRADPSPDLEADLRGALARAARSVPDTTPAPLRHRDAPSPAARFEQLPPARAQAMAQRPPAAPSSTKGGARNIIAISLSVAVVGFTAHQVSLQWSSSRAGLARGVSDGAASRAEAERDASILQTGFTFQPVPGRPADLMPPAAAEDIPEAKVSAADAALHDDIRQAERVLQAAEAAAGTKPEAEASALRPAEERGMMERAMSHLKNGDIAAARLFFEHLAKRGSAAAAVALGKTYDSRFLASFGVKGLQPNPAMARKWYDRATELGSREAAMNLVGR